MKKEFFNKEVELCRKLNQENNGKCNWGECDKCGVIPLLHKLYKGKLLENREEIQKIKKEIFDKKI